MFPQKLLRLGLISIALVFVTAVLPPSSSAQTWVPPKNQGLVLLNYQYQNIGDHVLADERRFDLGEIQSHSLLFGLDLGMTDRLAMNVALAFVSSRYQGPFPEADLDDGSFNNAVQDGSVGARYMVLKAPFVLTPFASYGFPTHNYQVVGHAAVGRNLNAFTLGLGAGRDFYPLLPNGYFQATHAYSFREDIDVFNLDTHSLFLELGYMATSSLSLRGFGNYLTTVNGVQWGEGGGHGHIHDQAAGTESVILGAGLGYQFSYRVGSFVSIMTMVDGKNTHDATGINIGTSYYFETPW